MANLVRIQGEYFFVCAYTGALIKNRFFIPCEDSVTAESFATLPVILRSLKDRAVNDKEFFDIKNSLCVAYDQQDIPLQPALGDLQFPLSEDQLFAYLSQGVENGVSWLIIEMSENADEFAERQMAQALRSDQKKTVKKAKVGKGSRKRDVYQTPKGVYVSKENTLERVTSLAVMSNKMKAVVDASSLMDEESRSLLACKKGEHLFLGLPETGEETASSKQWLPSGVKLQPPFFVFSTKQSELPVPPKKRQFPQIAKGGNGSL